MNDADLNERFRLVAATFVASAERDLADLAAFWTADTFALPGDGRFGDFVGCDDATAFVGCYAAAGDFTGCDADATAFVGCDADATTFFLCNGDATPTIL